MTRSLRMRRLFNDHHEVVGAVLFLASLGVVMLTLIAHELLGGWLIEVDSIGWLAWLAIPAVIGLLLHAWDEI
jgi:hypothetical protein